MIRDICKDELFLARKAAPASPEDLSIAQDLPVFAPLVHNAVLTNG